MSPELREQTNKRPLSLGEINYRIYLTVTEINNLIDSELRLNELRAYLKRIRKQKDVYVKSLRSFENEAQLLKMKYLKLIDELSRLSPATHHLQSTILLRYYQLSGNTKALDASEASPDLLLSPSHIEMKPLEGSRLQQFKLHWLKRQRHFRASSHSTRGHGEAHLVQLQTILTAKRLGNLGVQRGIRAAEENIKMGLEELKTIELKFKSPPRHIYEKEFNQFNALLRMKFKRAHGRTPREGPLREVETKSLMGLLA